MICTRVITCFNNSSSDCGRYGECVEISSNKYIVAQENSKKYCLVNPDSLKIGKIHVDGGSIVDEENKKCDYLFVFETSEAKNGVFIELKGKDCYTAINQIYETINVYKSFFNRVFARIVCRACPNFVINDANTVRLKKLVKTLNGNLRIKSDIIEEKTNALFS